MKFIALLKKELRECLPFIIAAALLLLVLGSLGLKRNEQWLYNNGLYPDFKPASAIDTYQLHKWSPINDVGPLVFVFSIALGLAIGIRQFWVAFYSRAWGFETCRPTKRVAILAAKLTAAIIGFIVSVGLIWPLFYWYASQPGIWFTPSARRVLIEGWVFIALGFVAYLGVALAGLSTARWYTTKTFSQIGRAHV